jgi:hypothetical protein
VSQGGQGLPPERLSPAELTAWEETERWIAAESSRFRKLAELTRKPLEYAYGKVPESVRDSIAGAILGVLTSVRDGGAGLISLEEVRQKTGAAPGPDGVLLAELQGLEEAARGYLSQSKNACMAEGAATGLAGLPGMVVDIPALYGLLFRLIAQIAACFGYSTDSPAERIQMLKVLDLGHQLDPDRKQQGIDELQRMQSAGLPADVAAFETQRYAAEKGLQTLARHLGSALTQRKLAQSVALVGSLVGAGVNRQLAADVGEVAFHAYRLRHLRDRSRYREAAAPPGSGSEDAVATPLQATTAALATPTALASGPTPAPPGQRTAMKKSGSLSLEVDAETLNLLLQELGPGGQPISYQGGCFVARRSGVTLSVTGLPLCDSSAWLNSPLGPLDLRVAKLELAESQVRLQLDVRTEGA